jgi:ubiquinone/menaquinone biosynthesis C-methylase UbiE
MCGLDRSLEQVSRASRLRGIPNNLEFQPWDGHTISSNERSFNHVISCAAVIASPRPAALLREIGRVLVAEGSLSLIEPTPCTPTPARDLLAMLLDAGFVETACLDDGRGWLLANATRRH